MDVTPVLVVATLAGLVGWVVWVISTNIRRRQATEKVAALHAKVLERCSDSNELLRYLESDQGRRFLESAAEDSAHPASRILGAIQAGLVIGGAGIFGVGIAYTLHSTDARDSMLALSFIALGIGVGFLISAAASYVLSKSWGLLTPRTSRM
jgi:hypothetical protein